MTPQAASGLVDDLSIRLPREVVVWMEEPDGERWFHIRLDDSERGWHYRRSFAWAMVEASKTPETAIRSAVLSMLVQWASDRLEGPR